MSVKVVRAVTSPARAVYVVDRENHRVEVFDGNGKFETQ
jgi:hypothetical protein